MHVTPKVFSPASTLGMGVYCWLLQVTVRKIRKFVKTEGLDGYVETSAILGGEDVDRVFHEAIRLGLGMERDTTSEAAGGSGTIDAKEPIFMNGGFASQASWIEKFCTIL